MKRILAIIGLVALFATTAHAVVISTNVTSGGVYLLSTARGTIYSIEVTSGNSGTVDFFDCDSVAAPFYGTNYTNAAWTTRTSTSTNYVTSYVGYNGYTNWYTNAGIWTATATNAASTNSLTALATLAVAGNTYVVSSADALFVKGLCIRTTTNASVVVNYRPSQ